MADKKQKLLTDGTPQAPEAEPIECEYIPKPKFMLKLDLEKTRAYNEQLMSMDAAVVNEQLRQSLGLKMALIGERIIMFLEEMAEATTLLQKRAIAENIEILTAAQAKIANARTALEKSIGVPMTPLPAGQQPAPPVQELSFEDFAAQVKAELKAKK